MEPAKSIIARLGGPARAARITGTAYTAPYRWMAPADKGGTGGTIPLKHVPRLLAFARDNGIELTAADFIPAVDGAAPQSPPVPSHDGTSEPTSPRIGSPAKESDAEALAR